MDLKGENVKKMFWMLQIWIEKSSYCLLQKTIFLAMQTISSGKQKTFDINWSNLAVVELHVPLRKFVRQYHIWGNLGNPNEVLLCLIWLVLNRRLSDVFRGYRSGTMVENGLMFITLLPVIGPPASAERVLKNRVCPSFRLSVRFLGIGSLVFSET